MTSTKKTSLYLLAVLLLPLVEACASRSSARQAVAANMTLSAAQLLADIASGHPLSYTDVVVEGDVDLTLLAGVPLTPTTQIITVGAPLYFERCQFKGKVTGFGHRGDTTYVARFTSAVSFQNCRFEQEVDLRGSTFEHHFYLNNSLFDQQMVLQAARVDGDLRLENADFSGDLLMQEIVVSGLFWANEAKIYGQFSVQQADFMQNALFSSLLVTGYADFGLANFRRSAYFPYGTFQSRVNYNGAIFHHRAEWTKARFEDTVDMQNVRFDYPPVSDGLESKEPLDMSGTASGNNAHLLTTQWKTQVNTIKTRK